MVWNMKYLFLVNPISGSGSAAKLIYVIENECKKRGLDYEIVKTTSKDDAKSTIDRLAPICDKLYVYVLGGDGSLFDAVNAAALRKNVSVGIIPCGSGNDFVRSFGDKKLFLDIAAQLDGKSVPIDLVRHNNDYSVNISSLGMDAEVAHHQKRMRLLSKINGSLSYIVSVFTAFIFNMNNRFKIIADGETLDGTYLFVVISNGRFYGGGFQPTPMSSIRDGYIDLMLINAVSRLKVVQLMNCYREGKHLDIKGLCKHRRVKRIEVHTEKNMTMQMDGELFCGNSFVFEMIAGGLNFIVPSTVDICTAPCLAKPALEKPRINA